MWNDQAQYNIVMCYMQHTSSLQEKVHIVTQPSLVLISQDISLVYLL